MAQQDTDEIFREVDEELRKERFEQLWKAYGTYVAIAALALVLGVGGWKLMEHVQAKRMAEAGGRFNAALLLLDSKKPEDTASGEQALRDLVGGSQGGYKALARMRLAAIEQSNGRVDAAVKSYDGIAADSSLDSLLRGLAALKAAMLRSDTADWTEMQNRLTPLKDVKNPWHLSAKELLGLAAWKAGKLAEAEEEFQSLVENRNAPRGIKQRAEMMLSLLLDAAKSPAQAVIEPPPPPAATAAPQGAAKDKTQTAVPAGKSGAAKGAQK